MKYGEIRKRFNSFIGCVDDTTFSESTNNLLQNYIIEEDGKKLEELNGYMFNVASINALLEYLNQTQKIKLEHLNLIKIYNTKKYMALDITARRNLELTERMVDKSKKGTLLWVLDKTITSMGGRLLRKWIGEPLVEVLEIKNRQDAVECLKNDIILRGELTNTLKTVYDIERLAGKISYGNCNARDLIALKNSLIKIPEIKELLKNTTSDMLNNLYSTLDTCEDLKELIENAIVEEPPITIKEGGIIKQGYNRQVDEYKNATNEGKNWLLQLEQKEKEKTGIKNLKVGFNKIFGYYFEVTKSYLNQVPERYIRKQTLANCERYITEELNELESKILGAEEKILELEYELFIEIRNHLAKNIERLQKTANVIANLDVLNSFATVAQDMNYCKPVIDNNGLIDIKEGRHPVIEKMLETGSFVENDTYLDEGNNRLSIITGPNMAGKSTYMRQVALIVLMSQIR